MCVCVYLFCLHLQHLTATAAAAVAVDVAYCCMLMFVIVVLLLPFIVAILICMKRRRRGMDGPRCKQLPINGRGSGKATLLDIGLPVFVCFSSVFCFLFLFFCCVCFLFVVLIILLLGHIRITRKLHKIVVQSNAKRNTIKASRDILHLMLSRKSA